MHSLSRLKLRGSRLVDTEPGLLWLVAEDGSNWAEGMGRVLAGLAARTADRDGLVKSTESDFVGACHYLQILPPQPIPNKYGHRYPHGLLLFYVPIVPTYEVLCL